MWLDPGWTFEKNIVLYIENLFLTKPYKIFILPKRQHLDKKHQKQHQSYVRW